jgi:hypothetical protein
MKLPDGTVGIVCGSRARAARCQVAGCRQSHTALCDHPVEGDPNGRTCDVKLCDLHRTQIGPGTDLCPDHAKQALISEVQR